MVLLNATLTDLFLDNVVVYDYLIHHNFYDNGLPTILLYYGR